jgi:predicted acylesterase/phospholipase RssA/CRP-like cAMP-binding protein
MPRPASTDPLARAALFAGLDAGELEEAREQMQLRTFAAGEALCREGEPAASLFVLVEGTAAVLSPGGTGLLARIGSGEVVGEMGVVTGEPRSATVVADVETTALELDAGAFSALAARSPALLANVSRILSRRLAAARRELTDARPPVVLVVPEREEHRLGEVVAAAASVAVHPVEVVDAHADREAALARLEGGHATHVIVVAGEDAPEPIAGHDVRTVVLDARSSGRIARELTGTALGLALGAGGAKGYAHVGVLAALEEEGYELDYLAGSSMGAVVAAWYAQGMSAAEIDETMRRSFTPENVKEMFKLSLGGASSGAAVLERVLRETTEERTFADLGLPLSVMTVDLESGRPAAISEGPVWEALMAATAIPGMFAPVERAQSRLVDGIALVPVPTGEVLELGAGVVVAVDVIGAPALPAWPGSAEPPPVLSDARRPRMLDTLLEVMDLARAEASARHAALADVVVTPRFGPGTWRDFQLADLFRDAGRSAADDALPALRALVRVL